MKEQIDGKSFEYRDLELKIVFLLAHYSRHCHVQIGRLFRSIGWIQTRTYFSSDYLSSYSCIRQKSIHRTIESWTGFLSKAMIEGKKIRLFLVADE